jgi:DNA processing protein
MHINRITFNQYPLLLRQISNPPKFLDIAGADIPIDEYKFLCIVGARNHSEYGEEVCKYLISGLKGYPIVIVSGLALGIDSIAHQSALETGLRTIAIPGSGLDESSIYPPTHINLAKKIIESGNTLISPFEPNQQSAIWTFPSRNRVMAGISHATIIIEGRVGSGTLLTANHALEFNREVMIIPGSIFSETTYGPLSLLKEGAIPITSPKEILATLGLLSQRELEELNKISPAQALEMSLRKQKRRSYFEKRRKGLDLEILEKIANKEVSDQKIDTSDLSEEEKDVLQVLKNLPLTNSDLMQACSMSPIKLNIILSQLELKDLIINDGEIIKIKH